MPKPLSYLVLASPWKDKTMRWQKCNLPLPVVNKDKYTSTHQHRCPRHQWLRSACLDPAPFFLYPVTQVTYFTPECLNVVILLGFFLTKHNYMAGLTSFNIRRELLLSSSGVQSRASSPKVRYTLPLPCKNSNNAGVSYLKPGTFVY